MPTCHTVIGAGPLGRATAHALLQYGAQVRLVHRSGLAALPGVETRAADVHDPRALHAALAGSAVVYFCAQPAYTRWHGEFRPMLDAVLETCERLRATLVMADNLYMYGDTRPGVPLSEATPEDATSRKGRLRASMAARVMTAHQLGWLPTVIGRGSDFFGADVSGSVLGERIFRAVLEGGTVRAVGDIDQPHTYTYVDDFGRALAELGHTPRSWGQVWHVPNAPPLTTRALLEQAATIAGTRPRIRGTGALALRAVGLFIPEARETVELMPHFMHPYTVDDSRWRRHLKTCETPLAVALAETLQGCRRGITTAPQARTVAGG